MSAIPGGQKEATFVSSLPDYAQIFMFLRNFGAVLSLPPISLSDLEDFFLSGHSDIDNVVVGVQWRLLVSVTRRENRKDWKKMARRFAIRCGLIAEMLPYSDIPVEKRMEVFKLACEGQFDHNLPFRAELKKLDLPSDKPVGTDRSGHRYWLLKDSTHDVRLYREGGYDELPPNAGSWELLARSVDDIGDCIANMTDKKSEEIETESSLEWAEVDEMEVCSSEDGSELVVPKPQLYSEEEKVTESKRRWKKGGRREGGGGGGGVTTTQDGGCLVCGLDNDYQNMLLCDFCDEECHMYCLYPKLWAVPRGKWACPLCNERVLIERLKAVHSELATARYQYEKATERKQRNVIRLQRSGLLLQNIILSDSSTERTRRPRKVVNYAELNDVYLPPLGLKDSVASGNQPSSVGSTTGSIQCVATRVSRRLRGMCKESEQSSKNSVEGRKEPVDGLPDTAVIAVSEVEKVAQGLCEQDPKFSDSDATDHTVPSCSNTANTMVEVLPHNSWNQDQDVLPGYPAPFTAVPVPAQELPVWNGSWTNSE